MQCMIAMIRPMNKPTRSKAIAFRRSWTLAETITSKMTKMPSKPTGLLPWTPERALFLISQVAQSADRAAFADLFNHFAPRLRSYCARQGVAPDVASELVQETMLTLWRKAASFDPAKAQVSTWLFTIIRNKRIDRLRRENRPEITADDLAIFDTDETSAHDEMSASQDAARLSVALDALPPEQRSMMIKAFFEDKSHSDIAAETGLPLGTVKSRIRLALSRLKLSIKE
jgi:RNA polymerase sigma factor (sigma-70 family)